jgi:hypothetical protein
LSVNASEVTLKLNHHEVEAAVWLDSKLLTKALAHEEQDRIITALEAKTRKPK